MAIKRKAVKKGKTIGESSSRREKERQEPPPPPRFRTARHKSFYESHTRKRAVVLEKPLATYNSIFDSLPRPPLARGWGSFANHPSPCCLKMVQEFYANGRELPTTPKLPRYESYVRGVRVPYDASVINAMFGMPPPGDGEVCNYHEMTHGRFDPEEIITELCVAGADWTKKVSGQAKGLKRKDLKPLPMEFLNFILATIQPSKHCSEVTLERVFILYNIMTGHYIDLGRILADEIYRAIESSRAITCPSLIYKLCVHAGVPEEIEDLISPGEILGVKMIQRRKSDFTFVPPTRLSDESEGEYRERCTRSNQVPPSSEDRFMAALRKNDKKMNRIIRFQKFLYKQMCAIGRALKVKKRERPPSLETTSGSSSGQNRGKAVARSPSADSSSDSEEDYGYHVRATGASSSAMYGDDQMDEAEQQREEDDTEDGESEDTSDESA